MRPSGTRSARGAARRRLQLLAQLEQMTPDQIARLSEVAIWGKSQHKKRVIVDVAQDEGEVRQANHRFGQRTPSEGIGRLADLLEDPSELDPCGTHIVPGHGGCARACADLLDRDSVIAHERGTDPAAATIDDGLENRSEAHAPTLRRFSSQRSKVAKMRALSRAFASLGASCAGSLARLLSSGLVAARSRTARASAAWPWRSSSPAIVAVANGDGAETRSSLTPCSTERMACSATWWASTTPSSSASAASNARSNSSPPISSSNSMGCAAAGGAACKASGAPRRRASSARSSAARASARSGDTSKARASSPRASPGLPRSSNDSASTTRADTDAGWC